MKEKSRRVRVQENNDTINEIRGNIQWSQVINGNILN